MKLTSFFCDVAIKPTGFLRLSTGYLRYNNVIFKSSNSFEYEAKEDQETLIGTETTKKSYHRMSQYSSD